MTSERYTMKIPRELMKFFQDYITSNPGLGFKTVSQFTLHILQEKAIEIKEKMNSRSE